MTIVVQSVDTVLAVMTERIGVPGCTSNPLWTRGLGGPGNSRCTNPPGGGQFGRGGLPLSGHPVGGGSGPGVLPNTAGTAGWALSLWTHRGARLEGDILTRAANYVVGRVATMFGCTGKMEGSPGLDSDPRPHPPRPSPGST